MTTAPDFRALCSELIEELEVWISYGNEADCADAHSVVDRARAALATPPPEPVAYIHRQGNYWEPSERVLQDDEKERGWTEEPLYAAAPPPEPPTDEEIAAAIQKGADQEFYATVDALTQYCGCGVELTSGDAREVLYELRRPHIALDCWGNEKQ